MNLKSNIDIVEAFLRAEKSLRDDDYRLISNVLGYEIQKKYGQKVYEQCIPFLKLHSEGRLPSVETIRRNRQLLQEKHKDLRGKRYKERTGTLEKKVKQQVIDLK